MLSFEFHLGPLHIVFSLGDAAEVEGDESRDVDMGQAQTERAPEPAFEPVEDRCAGFRVEG